MRNHRLEDLGLIYEKLTVIMDEIEDTWGQSVKSKHTIDAFIKYHKDEQNLAVLHNELRYLKEKLEDVYHLARSNEEHDENEIRH